MKKTAKKAPKKHEPYAILANKSYGLYAGIVESFDAIAGVAVVRRCRHVAQWYGSTGGVTSLASDGLCGPRAAESRIGKPVNATLTSIVNVFECSTAARATLDPDIK